MKLTVLTLDEFSRLEWRKELTRYFRITGDWSIYLMPPCILIGKGDSFDDTIDIGNGCYSFSRKAVFNGFAYILPIESGIVRTESEGLFVSWNHAASYEFPAIRAAVGGIALVEWENNAFRIIRSRRLRKDIKS